MPEIKPRRMPLIFWKTLLICMLALGISGCTVFEIHLIPPPSPLKEKVLSGEGRTKVLLLEVSGLISNQKSSSMLSAKEEQGMVARIREALNKAEQDDDVRAILLSINSPGGTVTSSDIIYHEIQSFKEKNNVKVYAQIMDLAASGGYYVAQAADKIVAHPTSITGSIGVITLKLNLKGLMDKVGVDFEVVKSGDKKDFLSPFRALTDEERALFQAAIDDMHDRFVEVITKNRRHLSEAQVRKLADGRVFTANQALEAKLIDHIGYLDDTQGIIKKDLALRDFQLVTYHRAGEYKDNIYSLLEAPSINMVNFDFNFLPKTPEPQFLYLWIP
ncbi:signal peptide peptidase SppA [Nitrospina watsonii]|uniref:Signal peptide peptidase SppA n=1 Tax=Nitrospina watsonii TaxID=1323948 RepID=A0ABN8W2N6_9BACT|nr:signal peptide peptidase SppA [Nitrospina watsonii]CAI2718228.1 Putative Signal peptide peptidase SppA [Nitrospina watsonii]